MLSTADIAEFLAAKGIEAPVHVQGDVPEQPDEIVMVDSTPGLGSTYELLFDRPAIRIRVRGKQADPASAEALAGAVDEAMLSPGTQTIGGKHVTVIQRLSGPPSLVGLDSVGGSRRVILEATYIPELERL